MRRFTPDSKYFAENYCRCGHHRETHPGNGCCTARGMRRDSVCRCMEFRSQKAYRPGVTYSGKEVTHGR